MVPVQSKDREGGGGVYWKVTRVCFLKYLLNKVDYAYKNNPPP